MTTEPEEMVIFSVWTPRDVPQGPDHALCLATPEERDRRLAENAKLWERFEREQEAKREA